MKRHRVLWSVILGLLSWEVGGRMVNPLFFAPFSKVVVALWSLALGGDLWRDIYTTLVELVLGFAIGSSIGLAGGILAGINRPFRDVTDPWVSFLYSTPYVAFTPLLVLWLGLGISSKVAIAVMAVFVPVWWNAYLGISSADPNYVEVAVAFSARKWQVLQLVLIRSALPSILVGLRLAFSRGLIAVVVAEFLASTQGLGFLIDKAGSFFEPDKLLAGVLILGGFTVAVVEILKQFEKKVAPWGFGR